MSALTTPSREGHVRSVHVVLIAVLATVLTAVLIVVGLSVFPVGSASAHTLPGADSGLRQLRMDGNSLMGNHAPGVPHVHLESYAPGARVPTVNNHIPYLD